MAKTGRKLAVGTLIGAGIGYLAGILTAPKSGRETRQDIKDATLKAKTEAERAAIAKSSQAESSAIQDETIARLADDYEKGAVLSFFFADQLKDIESAGFDLANFFADMVASFDPARKAKRPAEYADARQRAVAAREARLAARIAADVNAGPSVRDAALLRDLTEIEDTLRKKDYNGAEARLLELLK